MSLLSRLFGRSKPKPEPRHALAMVMLPGDQPVDGRAVLDHLAATWGDLPAIAGVESSDGRTIAAIRGGMLAIAQVPMPIPATDLEGPVALAWHWPEAAERVAAHRQHLLVHAASDALDALDLRLFHTRLVASALAVSQATGVYAGDAMLVRSAEAWAEDARSASRAEPPILSWIGFNVVAEPDATSAYTTGLSSFGHRELEVRRTARPPGDVIGSLADLANYLLASGRSFRDGDTFGATASDRTRIRFARSEFIPDLDVAVLEIG